MAGVLIVGVGVLFAFNFFKPIMVGRYLFAVSLLICAMMAALAEKLAHDRRWFGLLAVVSIIAAVGSLAWLAPQSRWLGGARIVARIGDHSEHHQDRAVDRGAPHDLHWTRA